MEFESLVNRLDELSKIGSVNHFLFCRSMEIDLYCEDDFTHEFRLIEEQLDRLFTKEINERSLPIFECINLRSFDIKSIEDQLIKLSTEHVSSREMIEIKRDNIFKWSYNEYRIRYKSVEKLIPLKKIDEERKTYSSELKEELVNQLTNIITSELKDIRLRDYLFSLDGLYQKFINKRAFEIYNSRSGVTIERDTYAYLDLESYQRFLGLALDKAIDLFQEPTKKKIAEEYVCFLRREILKKKYDKYSGGLDTDLYSHAINIYENRTIDKIEEDRDSLIHERDYYRWRYIAIEIISKEFPSIFTNARRGFSEDSSNDKEDYEVDNARYTKYGGSNGFDDNTIDDAFEGDPSNTSNID